MTKISNQRAYIPDEEINGLDYLPGTDFDQALKTVNFRVQDLGTHYNQVNGVRNFDFNFYAHSEPTAKPINGYFYSNSNEKNPNNIEYFIFSKVTASGKIVGTFFEGLVSENPFDLTISQKVDVNSTFYFKIDSVESFTHYYKVNVSEIYFPPINLMEYTISFNVFYLKSSGVSQHNNLLGLNEGDYIHLTALEKAKFNALPDSFATKTSDLTNDGEDSTSTYLQVNKNIKNETPLGTINGINAIFTTQFPLEPNSEDIFVNGQKQVKPYDYNISVQTITFTFSPNIDEVITINYIKQ